VFCTILNGNNQGSNGVSYLFEELLGLCNDKKNPLPGWQGIIVTCLTR
jgi:hypothetical protein